MLRTRGTSIAGPKHLWLLAPAVFAACLLNPQGEDPSGDRGGTQAGGTSAVDAGPSAGGSGGSAMGGSPGAGGSTAAGGAGAAAGAGPIGGTGGSAVPGLCPTDGSLPPANAELMPESGYIDDADATGILGPWYTLSCDSAQVDPAVGEPVVPVEGQVCFSGTVPQAAADDPDACWGAAIGFDLCTAPEDPSSLPEPQNTWEPGSAHTAAECGVVVSGVSFELSGQVPPELRIVFQEAGREDSLYAVVSEAGAVCQCVADIPLGVDAGAPGVSADDLQAIHIQVVPSEVGPVSFDFCIGNLSVW